MKTVTAIIEPDADGTLHLPLPETWRNQMVRVRAELELVETGSSSYESKPSLSLQGFGCLRGKISMAPDFDEPLDDFKEYTA